MKLKVPDGWDGFFILGVEYKAAPDGTVEVADGWAAKTLIDDHGFTVAIDAEPAAVSAAVDSDPEVHDQ